MMTPEEIAAMKAENETAKAEAAKWKTEAEKLAKKPEDKPKEDDDDLADKARKAKEADDKNKYGAKRLESALRFNLGLNDFVKTNKDILPADIGDILKLSDKENYDTAAEKANAIKVGVVNSFFSVQAHVDMLTQAQKNQLEDFKKLTKNGKEDKAEHIYENIFEPALETLKKVKKAEELGKSRGGFATQTTIESEYRDRLMKSSKRTHLNDKGE